MQNEFSRLVSQFRNEQNASFNTQANGFSTNSSIQPASAPKRRIEITLDYQLRNTQPALRIGDSELINKGEFITVIGAPASGKSNLLEDLMAGFVCHVTNTPYPYSMVDFHYPAATSSSRGLFIDFERPSDDVARSLKRTLKRLSVNESLIENGRLRNVATYSMIELETAEQKREEIRQLLEEAIIQGTPFDYLILDGCLDLTKDMNDSEDAVLVVRWIRTLASEFNLAIICTLHPNKNSETAAGHFGSFLHRYSRAFLLLKLVSQPDGTRVLTSSFDLGKLSHSHHPVEKYFNWDTNKDFFMPVDYHKPIPKAGQAKLKDIIQKAFSKLLSTQASSMELKKVVLEISGENESKVKRMLSEAVEFGHLRLEGTRRNATYHLCIPKGK
ncbi:AAA family ATPase [Xanthocytophaga flava]|uniref:AAA family ATPase n=1 Tax=Xanthocytophaga flava TaxID=3048013 RepID=UPI0028D4FDDE|nr:AAA family ATPase [Xanthocytophaga flavus]MDJ1467284.1 AAA family ATPase [Xanthocytophaga flavus]